MFVIHITWRNGDKETVKTSRVTYFDNAPGRKLLLGTLPDVTVIAMEVISSYWIEHE